MLLTSPTPNTHSVLVHTHQLEDLAGAYHLLNLAAHPPQHTATHMQPKHSLPSKS